MQRITMVDLEGSLKRLNTLLGRPVEPWNHDGGKMTANIGNIHLSGAYGGVQVHEMSNEGGGIRTLTSGYGTKREVYQQIRAMITVAEMQTPNT
jgi:hypothetical protein